MEHPIALSELNDFIFCPASIYFHNMYKEVEGLLYKATPQIKGSYAHSSIDQGSPSQKEVVSGISVYSEKYGLYGKIDKYIKANRELVESKRIINRIYDGYVFQLYGQYFGMIEAGYSIDKLSLYAIENNKKYQIKKPEDDREMLNRFEELLKRMRTFTMDNFSQENKEKCKNCIYSAACKWGGDACSAYQSLIKSN